MADDGSKQGTNWPLPKFHFNVKWDNQEITFQEVYGLDTEAQITEYRPDKSPMFSNIKMPGLKKLGNITMKKGVSAKDKIFWDWYNEIQMNIIKRNPVTISLLDETGAPTMVWKLTNAWPTKITATDLESDANEVAIEVLEIAHEGLVIAND